MKKSILALLMVASFGVFAQPDIEVTMLSPASNDNIVAGTQFNFDVKIKNTGNVAIDNMDTIAFYPIVNGSPINSGGQPLVYAEITSIAVGDSASFTRQLAIQGGSSGQLNFCASAFVLGAGWTGVTESDTTNNSSCANVSYNSGSVGNSEFTVQQSIDDSYYSNGIYYVKMQNYSFGESTVMNVFNITGAKVYSAQLNHNGNKIDQDVNLPSMGSGVYIVQISSNNQALSTRKIVVE